MSDNNQKWKQFEKDMYHCQVVKTYRLENNWLLISRAGEKCYLTLEQGKRMKLIGVVK